MARAEQEVADLDAALAEDGEDIEIWRLIGTQQIPIKVKCRAFVRGYSAEELVGGISQTDSRVVISPTEIIASGWPGPQVASPVQPNANQDHRVPRKGDKAVIAGRTRNIEIAHPIYIDGQLVRINMRVLG